MDTKNLSIVRQSFANTVFTHKVQEVASERNEQYSLYVKLVNIVLVGIVLLFLCLQLVFADMIILSYLGAGITVAEVLFLIAQLTFNFENKAIIHKNTALKYLNLRDLYRSLIVDIMNEKLSSNEIRNRRDFLQNEYSVISDLAPQTNNIDYKTAQQRLNKKGVVEGEDFTWSDEEIDHFLPENLRLKP